MNMKLPMLCVFTALAFAATSFSQELKPVHLNSPDTSRGLTLMQALSKRASVRSFSNLLLSTQDISDLLWAANGVNRPDKKLRTAPSAMNAQDIDIYVFLQEGIYLYDALKNMLTPVIKGDFRAETGKQEFCATVPVSLVLVSDLSKFRLGTNDQKLIWAACDAGVISQNISLFCAANGLATVPRAGIDADTLKTLLKLSASQKILLNHPIGFPQK
jgi:SagB-type dehydrogenase family enzyme